MMRIIRIIFMVLVSLSSARTALSQNESTLYFMSSLPQVSYTNPAIQPRYRFSLGLPGSSVFFQYANNGFKYNDFAGKQGDSVVANLNKFYSSLKKKNYITMAAQADLFRLSMKVNARMYFTWNITAKSYSRQMFPKELFGILINGTSNLLNRTVTVSPQVETLGYLESGWGASYIVNKNLTVGARFKLLKGFVNATTAGSTVNLSISEDYAITATADMNLRTSGIHQLDEDDDFDIDEDWDVYKKNTGMAFDLGATYKLMNDKLTVGASLIDIGSITWKNDPYGYRLNPEKARYTFEGVDLNSILNDEDDYLEGVGDSLEANFDFEEGVIGQYRTPIPGKIYLSGSYALKKTLTVNALFFAEKFRSRFSPGFSASIQKEFGRRLSTSLSYTITNHSFNNLGAGISLNFAPIQFYLVGDNLLRAPIALLSDGEVNNYLNSTQFVNIRAGLNFVFGWDKTQEKLPYPKKS